MHKTDPRFWTVIINYPSAMTPRGFRCILIERVVWGGAYEAKLLKKDRGAWSNRLSIGRYFKPFLHCVHWYLNRSMATQR